MSTADRLLTRVRDALYADERKLRARIERARNGRVDATEWQRIAADVDRAVAARAARAARQPRVTYPPELPVAQRAEDIAQAIRAHPVVIVAGETGSGKTTQLPKICLDAGRGERGFIGHTQPRRIAARAVAARIAQELGTPLGDAVGYKVRFTDKTRPDAYVKLMTDGILLAETQGDRDLSRYDTIIVDEAHERSLNIDFLLGYLQRLLARRPRPQGVITSATIDAERFARHFAHAGRSGAGDHGVGAHVSRSKSAIAPLARATPKPTTKRSSRRRSRAPPKTCGAQHPATSSCSCPASARSARPPTCCGARSRGGRTRARSRSCRSTRG